LGFGVIAWLMSAPLIAYHFNQVNLWSIPAGLVMIPFVVASLLAGILKIVLTLLAPGFAPAWAALAVAPTSLMRGAVGELARIPGSYLPAPHLSVAMIFGYYVLVCLPLLAPLWPRGRWCLRLSPALACMLALLPLLVGAGPRDAGQHDLRLTLLSIGAGQTAVIELPSGGVVLVDDGSSTLNDPVRTCLEPFLRSQGCRRITAIFLSHPDFDHVSGTVETVEDLPTSCVYLNTFFRPQSVGSPHARYVLDGLAADHCPVQELRRGDKIDLDESTQIEVLWPPADHAFKSTNEAGLVLRLKCRGRSILFPADIEQLTQAELLENPSVLRSDVLVAPHHGSEETTTRQFIQAVEPQYIVASSDRLTSKKQKNFDALAAELGRPLFRTSRSGAIMVEITPQGVLRLRTFLPDGQQLPDAARWRR
jgi:competence protein ComEC